MKISCEIIKDLLPLYQDGVCSNDSRTMIEEHVAYCESCKAELQAMNNELPLTNPEHTWNEADAVKKLSSRWKKGMRRSLLRGVLITIGITILVGLVLYSFMGIEFVSKP